MEDAAGPPQAGQGAGGVRRCAPAPAPRRRGGPPPASPPVSSCRSRARPSPASPPTASPDHGRGLLGREGQVAGRSRRATCPWPRSRATGNGGSPRDASTTCSVAGACRHSPATKAIDSAAPSMASTSSSTRHEVAGLALGQGLADPRRVGLGPPALVGACVGALGPGQGGHQVGGQPGTRARSASVTARTTTPSVRSPAVMPCQADWRAALSEAHLAEQRRLPVPRARHDARQLGGAASSRCSGRPADRRAAGRAAPGEGASLSRACRDQPTTLDPLPRPTEPGHDVARRRHLAAGVAAWSPPRERMTRRRRAPPSGPARCARRAAAWRSALAGTNGGERVTRIRGDRDDVFSHGFICPKGSTLKQLHEDPDWLRRPLVKRDGAFVEVDVGRGVRRGRAPACCRSSRSTAATRPPSTSATPTPTRWPGCSTCGR